MDTASPPFNPVSFASYAPAPPGMDVASLPSTSEEYRGRGVRSSASHSPEPAGIDTASLSSASEEYRGRGVRSSTSPPPTPFIPPLGTPELSSTSEEYRGRPVRPSADPHWIDTASLSSTSESHNDIPKRPDRDEFAGAKLWAVYISEAEKFDKALVEGWKSDMEGLLIFAGLFSASLTAFLMESSKNLSPDQNAMTIALLSQISRQLDPGSNTTYTDLVALASFTPSLAALTCNTLWFIALGLSLACALIATLVEQWSRDFIQRTEMHPSPIIRARVFSYLYFGIHRFGMHALVEFIPLLLHISLLLFFAGLVAFLLPINPVVVVVTAVLFGLISASYIYLTVLPIISSDSPCRTPLSGVTWTFLRWCSTLLHWRLKSYSDEESPKVEDESARWSHSHNPTMVEVMNRDAIAESPKRDERDCRAIVWSVKSLTNNDELEPFVEAFPDLVWGPNGVRRVYNQLINMLIDNPETQLVQRIESLLRSCDSGLLPPDREIRRRISSIKALWAVAYFLASNVSIRQHFPVFDHALLQLPADYKWNENQSLVNSYSTSAYALTGWVNFCSISLLARNFLRILEGASPPRDLRVLFVPLQCEALKRGYKEFSTAISDMTSLDPADAPMLIQTYRNVLKAFEDKAYDPLMTYMRESASLEQIPYEFELSCQVIQATVPPSTAVQRKLQKIFTAILTNAIRLLPGSPALDHIDMIVGTLLHSLQLDQEYSDIYLGRTISRYVFVRKDPGPGFNRALGRWSPNRLGSLLTASLMGMPADTQVILSTIWSLCVISPGLALFDVETLSAVRAATQFPISACVVASLKLHILAGATELPRAKLSELMDRLQIGDHGSQASGDPMELGTTAPFMILIEFLEQIDTWVMRDLESRQQNIRTFEFLRYNLPTTRAPLSMQNRFATWIFDITHGSLITSHGDIIQAVVDWFWSCNYERLLEQFDDMTARKRISEALAKYVTTSPDGNGLRGRVEVLCTQLNPSSPVQLTGHHIAGSWAQAPSHQGEWPVYPAWAPMGIPTTPLQVQDPWIHSPMGVPGTPWALHDSWGIQCDPGALRDHRTQWKPTRIWGWGHVSNSPQVDDRVIPSSEV